MTSRYNREGLTRTLVEEFGIESPKELDRALKKSKPLDISIFVKQNIKQNVRKSNKQKVIQNS